VGEHTLDRDELLHRIEVSREAEAHTSRRLDKTEQLLAKEREQTAEQGQELQERDNRMTSLQLGNTVVTLHCNNHCCCTFVALLLHCSYTLVSLLLHGCYTVVTLSHYSLSHAHEGGAVRQADPREGPSHHGNAIVPWVLQWCYHRVTIV
jgi:hypothetical protein